MNSHTAPRRQTCRAGKVLVLIAVLLPALFGVLGLALDGSLMLAESRNVQHVADAAATAAAMELLLGKSSATATSTATDYVHTHNGVPLGDVTVSIPPTSGPYAGRSNFVEVLIRQPVSTHLIQVVGVGSLHSVTSRAVAGVKPSTVGAAIVVLDPNPPPLSLAGLPVALPLALPSLPSLTGGLEVEGLGQLTVDGAVLVNTEWGGVDQDGNPAGQSAGPPYGIACMPLLPLMRLAAPDIRVVGGVDNPANYRHIDAGEASPLQANRLPVPDPFAELPVPTLAVDASNVSDVERGGVRVIGLPLLGPTTELHPGVYEWIEVVSGNVVFHPGVYIIRGVNPLTQIALNVIAAKVTAQGVMFYVTNTPAYSPSSGAPDAADAATMAPPPQVPTLVPSVVINVGLLGSNYSGLNDSASPFSGMLIYQRRQDRRPIVLVQEDLIGSGIIAGTVYAKWGHTILAGRGTYNARFVTGTMRVLGVLGCRIEPDGLLPPVREVFLVE